MNVHARVYTSDGIDRYDDLEQAVDATGQTWIHVIGVDTGDIDALADQFDVHRLAIENVLDDHTRPKTEPYGTHTFVLFQTVRLSERDDVAFRKEIHTRPVGFFIGEDWLVTLSTASVEAIDPTMAGWTQFADRFATRGVDFLAYRLMDAIVDEYFDLLDDLEDDIEAVEERVLDEPEPRILQDLNDVRRDLLAFRKVAWPAREAVASLARGDVAHIDDANEKYFRDVYDHLVQVVDLIETYRDLTSGSRDIYHNVVSQSTNEVMKTLTVVATIFIPLTFVAGVYGMNFADAPLAMPELSWPFAYPAVMLGMAAIAVLMLVHFRRHDWL